MMYYGDHMSGWGWLAMSLSSVVFWGLVITAVVLSVRYLRNGSAGPAPKTPEQLLAERFARGEIDETEYRERLATLHGPVRS